MPETLAWLSGAFLFLGPVLVLMAIIPSDNRYPNDPDMGYRESWENGDSLSFVIAGVIMFIFGQASLRRMNWVRYFFPLYFLGQAIYSLVFRYPDWQLLCIGSVVWIFISSWYFFKKQTVLNYFSVNS